MVRQHCDSLAGAEMTSLEPFFAPFRKEIIGIDQLFSGPYGKRRILYADWTASGRLFAPIERRLTGSFGPYVANTHSESNVTGSTMTHAYHYAHRIIKEHVGAGTDDVIITVGSGMTAVVNKFQRILGLRLPDQLSPFCLIPEEKRPVVFVTHLEHHSNHTSWIETIARVEVIPPDEQGRVDLGKLQVLLAKYADRPIKIGAFSACSNVTGLTTPYHEMARIMHAHGGVCFVDFAASAPYIEIDMHPAGDPSAGLDAVMFSPHKFLGGPGSPGVLVFNRSLYHNRVPDQPGGGTVLWTNPWQEHSFYEDIETREDGGTPGFLQAIKAALAIRLKEAMGPDRIFAREQELTSLLFRGLRQIPGVHILADRIEDRLGIFSFYVEDVHYNLMVQLLNDRFGIQARGGCSCAGTYGHYLLHVDPSRSLRITRLIDKGDLSMKPGWVRLSVHPTTTSQEAEAILEGVSECVLNAGRWASDYVYSSKTNEFRHHSHQPNRAADVDRWFSGPWTGCCEEA